MSETLKDSLHQLVEEIDNEQLLETLRDFLSCGYNLFFNGHMESRMGHHHPSECRFEHCSISLRKETQPGKLWEELPEDKKQEILLALEESADESTLISREDFLKRKK